MNSKKLKVGIKKRLRRAEEYWLGKQIMKKSRFSAPDFMIIGATKAGTTSLFQYLIQHPQIVAPKIKEIDYFAIKRGKGIRWYLQNFPTKEEKGNRLTFEATPSYVYLEQVPLALRRLFPNIKLIVLFRDPIERAFSHWNYRHDSSYVNSGKHIKDKRSFNEVVEQELADPEGTDWKFAYIDRGAYVKQLKRWYGFFPKEQLLILDSWELKNKTLSTLKKTISFLGLSDFYEGYGKSNEEINDWSILQQKVEQDGKQLKIYNVNKYNREIDPLIERKLKEFYAPYDKELQELTGRTFSWMK